MDVELRLEAATTRIVARTHFVVRSTSRKGPRFTG
jgi:hypothetical protein